MNSIWHFSMEIKWVSDVEGIDRPSIAEKPSATDLKSNEICPKPVCILNGRVSLQHSNCRFGDRRPTNTRPSVVVGQFAQVTSASPVSSSRSHGAKGILDFQATVAAGQVAALTVTGPSGKETSSRRHRWRMRNEWVGGASAVTFWMDDYLAAIELWSGH